MSRNALAQPLTGFNSRRAHASRRNRKMPRRAQRPWSEIAFSGSPLRATSRPPQIKRPQLIAWVAAVLALHVAIVAYFSRHSGQHGEIRKSELTIELTRPPLPPEPPKVVEPKPTPVKPQVQAARSLPQIQQSDSPPAESSESNEVAIAAAPATVDAPPAATETATAPIGRAGYLNNPPPNYPAQAVKLGWEGTVLLRVHVLANGKVEGVEVSESSGRKLLDDEAIRTVRKWLFVPAKRGESPIDGWATVPIEFLLDT